MAKQLVGPVERHVEKVAVGVAGALLIGVIAQYLMTSPNQIELAGKTVIPSTIDELVAQKARDVARAIQNLPVPAMELEPLYDEFVSAIDPFESARLASQLPRSAPLHPEVPIIDPPEAIEGQRELVQAIQLTKPVTTHGRTMFDEGAGIVRNWVTASARLDRTLQSKRQASSYGAQWGDVVFGPVQLQRRAFRPDGSWSDDDWALVEPFVYQSYRASEPPEVTLKKHGNEIVVPDDVDRKITAFFDKLAEPARQLDMLRPSMPQRIVGTRWEFPIITSYNDVLIQDDEYLKPEQSAISEQLEDRYGLRDVEADTDTTDELTPGELIEKTLDETDRRLAAAVTAEDAILAFNSYASIEDDPDATPVQVRRAQRGKEAANQKQRDIIRKRRRGTGPVQEQQTEERKRDLARFQQVWVHDAQTDSVRSGVTYQYRMRVLIYNRLAGEPARFADPEDAKTVLVAGEWSEPSDPVTMEPDNYFFVAGCDKRKNEAKVELYRWFEGYWVMTREAFGIGDQLECVSRVSIPAPDDPTEEDRPNADFDAGATIVDIDLERPYRRRDELRGGGIRFSSSPDTDYSVVVAGPEGNLTERIVLTDKANPLRRKVNRMVYRHEARGD